MSCNNCNNCGDVCNCIQLTSSDSSVIVSKNGCILDFKVNPSGGSGNLTSLIYNSGTRTLTYTNNEGNSNNIVLANDIQQLALSGNIISLSKGGGSIDLTSLLAPTTFAATSTTLVITPGGTHGYTPSIQLVPSTDLGQALFIGTDGHPYVQKINLSTGGCLSFTKTIVGGISTYTPVIDYTCLGSNLVNGGWNTIGNVGTNPLINFLGTTDNVDLVFRRNNIISGQVGVQNTSFGYQSLSNNSIGVNNTAFGVNALLNNNANSNTALGWSSLQNNTTGSYNTAVGLGALIANIGGQQNVAIGQNTLANNTSGSFGIAIGTNSLQTGLTGDNNIAIGNNADVAASITTNAISLGTNAIAISNQLSVSNQISKLYFPGLITAAGYVLTDLVGNGNLSLAPVSGWSLIGNLGTNSTINFLGTLDDTDLIFRRNNLRSALLNNSIAATSFGVNALNTLNTGANNTAIGNSALIFNTAGNNNTAIGAFSLQYNTLGTNNTSLGVNSLNNTEGSYNTGIGFSAVSNNNGGSANTGIGYSSLNTVSGGSQNTCIGYLSDVLTSSTSNAIAIGANAIAESNQLAISPAITNIQASGLPTGLGYVLTDVAGNGNLILQQQVQNNIDEFLATSAQTIFILTQTPKGKVAMYISGLLVSKANYTLTGNTITYIGTPLAPSTIVDFIYIY